MAWAAKAHKNTNAGKKTVAASKAKKSVAKAQNPSPPSSSKWARRPLVDQLDALQPSTSIKFRIPSAPKAQTAGLESAELSEMDLDSDAEPEQGDDDESLDSAHGLDDQEQDELEYDEDEDAISAPLPSPPPTTSKKRCEKNKDVAKGA